LHLVTRSRESARMPSAIGITVKLYRPVLAPLLAVGDDS
jgi:hypothetical protein